MVLLQDSSKPFSERIQEYVYGSRHDIGVKTAKAIVSPISKLVRMVLSKQVRRYEQAATTNSYAPVD